MNEADRAKYLERIAAALESIARRLEKLAQPAIALPDMTRVDLRGIASQPAVTGGTVLPFPQPSGTNPYEPVK